MNISAEKRKQVGLYAFIIDNYLSNKLLIKQLMRISGLVTILLLGMLELLFATSSKGQSMTTDKVTIGMHYESLATGIKKIEQQTRLRFFYRNADIKSLPNLNLPIRERTVQETLDELLQNSFFSYRQINGSILLEVNNQTGYLIKGRLLNSQLQPVDFATVLITKSESNKIIQTTQTDSSGLFKLTVQESGDYVLKISAIGSDSLSIGIRLSNLKVIQLPDYTIPISNNQLKEVVIKGSKPIIRQEIDRITYDVQQDPDNLTNNALEMMKKVPMLSVDGENNLRLQGGSDYRIMIDGKPSSLLLRNPKDILKSMPATTIMSIEVITTPPSKYDSEGLAGIINLVTKKKQNDGYSGSVSISQKSPVGGPTLGLTYALKKGKFSASIFGGVGYSNQPEIIYKRNRTTFGSNSTNLNQNGLKASSNWFSYFDTEYSFELDSLNLLTAEVGFNKGINNGSDIQESILNNINSNVLIQKFNVDNEIKNTWDGVDLGLNFQHGFKKSKSKLITFSYKYRQTDNEDFGKVITTNRFNYNIQDFNQINNSGSDEQTVQVDYTFPINKIKAEAGIKGIFRNNNSDFKYNELDIATGTFVTDNARSNSFDNNQNVYSAYNSYTYNISNLGIKLGYRLERTFVSQNLYSSNNSFKTDYTNLVPALSLNYNFKNRSNINFGFSQRIQRPNIWVLNPYVDRSNPNYETTGNPNLNAVKSNNFQLRYSPAINGSLILGANYSFANNTIQEISTFDPSRQITSITYANLGKDKAVGLSVNFNYSISDKWTLNSNNNIRYVWFQGLVNNVSLYNSGFVGAAYIGSTYKFPKGVTLNSNFTYTSSNIALQTRNNGYGSFTIGANKELIKSKLIFSISVNNPFTKFRNNTTLTSGTYFTQTDNTQLYFRSLNFSLDYRFGKLKEKVKKTKKVINNDDAVKVPTKE